MLAIWKRGGRMRFAFSLRALLCVTTVTGAWLGWQLHVIEQRRAMRDWLDWREAYVCADLSHSEYLQAMYSPSPHWGELPWYRRWLGDKPVLVIELQMDVPNADKIRVKRAFPEAMVTRQGDRVCGLEPSNEPVRLTDEQFARVKLETPEALVADEDDPFADPSAPLIDEEYAPVERERTEALVADDDDPFTDTSAPLISEPFARVKRETAEALVADDDDPFTDTSAPLADDPFARVKPGTAEALVADDDDPLTDTSAARTDEQFAPIKRRRAAERLYYEKFQSAFGRGVQPPDGDLFELAPRIVDEVLESCLANYEAETLTLTSVIRALDTVGRLRAKQAQLRGEPARAQAAAADLTDELNNLRAIVRRQPRTQILQTYGEHLIDCVQAQHAARVAQAEGNVDEQRRTATLATDSAERLYGDARAAFAQRLIGLYDLVLPLELRREAELSVPTPGQAEAHLAQRVAWTTYQREIELRLGKVQALHGRWEAGGEAEKFYFLTARRAAAKAELARIAGDAVGQQTALDAAAAESEFAADAMQAAYYAEAVTYDLLLEAIDCRGSLKRAAARTRGDKALELKALEERSQALFSITARQNALVEVGDGMADSLRMKVSACHYLLARCELVEAQR